MAYREDEEKRIYELETAESLSAGTFVPVDKEGNEMAEKFDLGTALGEKVDEPETAPEAGQVLTFDGTENTWANPPEGVYVINYSEVTDISNIDINRAKSQPTFLLVDESGYYIEILHTAKSGQTSNRIDIPVGMIFRLTEMVDNIFTFTSPYTGTFYGGTTNGDCYNGIIKISLYTNPGETYLYKSINYEGSINNGSLNRNMPTPYNVYYSGDEDYGPWDSNAKVNSGASLTKMYEFNGKARKQIELPPTVLTRVLGSDTQIPTQKVFLGLDILGNQSDLGQYRFGSMIPFNVASQVDNNAYPYQTPTLTLHEFVMGNPSGELDVDQRNLAISMTLLDSLGSNTRNINYLFLPNTSNSIDANIVPNVPKYWTDSKGGHIDWKPVNEVPASTAQDEGKVLTVDSSGTPVWGQSGVAVVTLTEDLTTSSSTLTIDKTFTEIMTAIQNSQSIIFNYDKKSPIGTVRVFSGSDVQTVYGSYIAFNCVSSDGKVTSVQLKVDDTVSIVESNNLPTSASSDEGKVLTVGSNGTPVWQSQSSGGGTEIIRGLIYWGGSGYGIVLDKTYSQIETFLREGKSVTSQVIYVEYTPTTDDIDTEFIKQNVQILVSDSAGVLRILNGVPTISLHFPAWTNYSLFDSQGHIRYMILSMSDFTIEVRESDNLVFYYPSELEHITIQQDYPEDFFRNLTWSDFKILMGVYIASGKYPSIYLDDDSTNTPYVVVNYSGIDNATNGHDRFTGSQVNPQSNRLEIYQLEFFPETVDNVEKCKYRITTHYLAVT